MVRTDARAPSPLSLSGKESLKTNYLLATQIHACIDWLEMVADIAEGKFDSQVQRIIDAGKGRRGRPPDTGPWPHFVRDLMEIYGRATGKRAHAKHEGEYDSRFFRGVKIVHSMLTPSAQKQSLSFLGARVEYSNKKRKPKVGQKSGSH